MKKITITLLAFILYSFLSCKKDTQNADPITPAPAQTDNDVSINITNMANNVVLKIAKDTVYTNIVPKYINAYGDTLTVTKFMYYISNVKLKRADGSYYTENESYRLIDASDTIASCKFTIKAVPSGTYTSIEYLIGVDSLRNCGGAQTGALDVAHEMFWTWNSGYIFVKLNVFSSSVSNFGSHNVEYHVGGFSGANNNIKKETLALSANNLVVDNAYPSKIYLKANVMECFRTPTTISFVSLQSALNAASAKPIANNYADMFSLGAVVH